MSVVTVPDNSIFKRLNERISGIAENAGREPGEITLIAVTKGHPVEAMISACNWGLTTLGESRIQETEEKLPHFPYRDQIELHLIGHLQKNKVRKALGLYDVIESVDSLPLAERIDRLAGDMGLVQRVFLEVNTGNDPAKFGFQESELIPAAEILGSMKNLSIEGLMVVAPLTADSDRLRRTFSKTRQLKERLNDSGYFSIESLSMGMSSDYEIAIQEGATHLRLGTALFGKRN
ncbi:MAG: YggS family pyridoxal phosphate-dependent enzyme [FCB group bacterium]|nr:YggS family pyridoxal phosphate-dependent enzyme [FCB group bacterium]